ncbi:MAG: isoprenylcysteine carboxylmethyltransferase family protein [Desulfobacterales bacterium]|nr:MAG: isoprenylcysteine carboxylmethyltransferase family protein [Desulfobacterales bacterium]
MFSSAEYGLWDLVILHSLIFIIFGFSFFRPRTGRDWRTFGAFSAFLVALFAEMYGFPLTVYLLSGWLSSRFPEVDWLSHSSGHLLQRILGWQGNPHFSPLHIISDMLVIGGLILLASAWKVLYRAQKNYEIARSGPYAKIRHPQYTAFIIIMIGFLLQWPTLVTVLIFPILVLLYIRLARREEKESLKRFGDQYTQYVQSTPGFIPRIHLNAAS